MRRIQFIELHEQPWFPAFLRDLVTDALQCGLSLLKAYAPVSPMLQELLNATASRCVVDVCSGGGGPWLELSRTLRADNGALSILLTDKYPNRGRFETGGTPSGNQIAFRSEPVDATKVPPELVGVRTIFSSFHHFPPREAAAILQDAVKARQGIGVFEVTRRVPSAIAAMLPWAFLSLLYTPLIRPFRWSRLVWTYVVPIVPLVLLFDGVVSCLRSYSPRELLEIAGTLGRSEYEWKAGVIPGASGRMPVTYLVGWPQASG